MRKKKTFEEMTVSEMAEEITDLMFKNMSKAEIEALAALLPEDDMPKKKARRK